MYLNPAIIFTIKTAWFSSERAFGNQHLSSYVSSLPEHPEEKEFPIPMVALAVTCVRTDPFSYHTLI